MKPRERKLVELELQQRRPRAFNTPAHDGIGARDVSGKFLERLILRPGQDIPIGLQCLRHPINARRGYRPGEEQSWLVCHDRCRHPKFKNLAMQR